MCPTSPNSTEPTDVVAIKTLPSARTRQVPFLVLSPAPLLFTSPLHFSLKYFLPKSCLLQQESQTNLLPDLQHSTHSKRLHKHNPRLGNPPLLHPAIQHPFTPPLNLSLRAALHPIDLLCQALDPPLLPASRRHCHLSPSHLR